MALIKANLISHDLWYLQDKFGFSDEDMQSVPQAPFKYLRETFKDTAFRASQYKMLHKLIYTKKLLHICRLVDTNQCERCTNEVEDFKHLLWDCRYSVEIWKETERQINERFRTNLEIKYHNVIMGFNPENYKNHAAINTIIMAVKKRICYKDRLKTHDPATIKSIIEGRMNVEKYLEKKSGQTISRWEVIL